MELIRKKYNLSKEDIINILFIIIFWVPDHDICISNIHVDKIVDKYNSENIKYINLEGQIRRKYRIRTKKEFIDDIVKEKGLDQIKSFFYENIKCFSLYNFYVEFSCE